MADRYEFEISARDIASKEVAKVNNSILGLGNVIKTSVAAFATFNLAGTLAEIPGQLRVISDEFTTIQNMILNVEGEESLKKITDQMFDLANQARVGVKEYTTLFTRIDFAIKQTGGSAEEAERITSTLSKAIAVAGRTGEEASSAMIQISQAFNKGKLDGDEFRTVMETMPDVMQAIADKLGVTRGELINLAPQGVITADVMKEAILTMQERIDIGFSNSTATISQSFKVLRNNVVEAIGKLNEGTGASQIFIKAIDALTFFINSLNEIIIVSTALLVAYIIKIGIAAAANAITTVSILGLSGAFTYLTLSLKATIVSMLAFLATNPLGWIALLVIGLVTLYKKWDWFHDLVVQTLKAIGKALNWLNDDWGQSLMDMKTNAEIAAADIHSSFSVMGVSIDGITTKIKGLQANFVSGVTNIKNKVLDTFFPTIDSLESKLEGMEKSYRSARIGTEEFNRLGESIKNLKEKISDAKGETKNHSGAMTEAKEKTFDFSEEIKKLYQNYRDLAKFGGQELANLEASHNESIQSMTDKVNELKQSLVDIRDELSGKNMEFDQSLAEGVVDQQKKIADLQEQINKDRYEGKNTTALEKDLERQQQVLSDFLSQNTGLDDEINAVKERNRLTDFERFVADIEAKRQQAQAEYQEKKERIEQEISDQRAAQDEEARIYAKKREEYEKTGNAMDRLKDRLLGNLDAMAEGTKTRLEQLTSLFDNFRNSIESIGNSDEFTGSYGGVSFGGSSGSSSSASSSPASVSVNLDLRGSTVGTKEDMQSLSDVIQQNLVRALQKQRIGSS